MHDLQLYIREFSCGLFTFQEQTFYKFLERSFGEEEGFAVDRKSIDDMFNNYSLLFNNIHFASRQLFVN